MSALRDREPPDVETQLLLADLYSRYNLAVDLGEVEAWVGCFTHDGKFRITGHGEWSREADIPVEDLHGVDELRAFMGDVAQERSVRHWTTNLVLRKAGGDRVEAISLMTVWDLSGPRAGEVVLTGVMRDVLARLDGVWAFASRHLTVDK